MSDPFKRRSAVALISDLTRDSSKLPELAAAPPKIAGRDPIQWKRITPGTALIYGLMWAVTEVAPLSPPMARVTCS